MTHPHPHAVAERRRYAGLRTPAGGRLDLRWGKAASITAPKGALVAVENVDGGGPCLITALRSTDRDFSPAALDLPESLEAGLDETTFDARAMAAMAATRGTALQNARAVHIFDQDHGPGEIFRFRMREEARLFFVSPISSGFLESGGGGRFSVELRPQAGGDPLSSLPDPLCRVRDEWLIKRGSAQAYELKKGQFVQIIDVEGQQCSDFMAMRTDALNGGVERYIDSAVSRTMTRSAYPLPGLHDKFFDQDMKPLLSVRQDTVGRHDTFALACTARGYEDRGFPGHLNCSDNISAAYAPFGIQKRRAWPAINFFFNSWIDAGNAIPSDEAWSRAGDYVAMEALTDLVCVSTACPDDVDPINGWNPTDVHVRVYEEDTALQYAVCWRGQPEEPGRMTRQSPFHNRTAPLTSRFAVARDV